MYTYIRSTLFSLAIGCFLSTSATPTEVPARESKLSFVRNEGQVTDQYSHPRKDIDFKLNAPGMNLFVGEGQIHYQFTHIDNKLNKAPLKTSTGIIYRLDMELIGANKQARAEFAEPVAYTEHYYLAHTGSNGLTAHGFQKITYKNIYPAIDWVLYLRNGQLKYDFVVHPGGNMHDIKIKYAGASQLSISEGALMVSTPYGNITEQKPYSYLLNNNKAVASAFVLNGDILSFDIESQTETLVIDPILDWATYYGGSSYDFPTELATDAAGNVYMSGVTTSTNDIATSGAFLSTFSGTTGYVVKFDAAGTRLWGTYYYAQVHSIVCEPTGEFYITGMATSAANMATAGAHQAAWGGGSYDCFLAKFDVNGNRIWSTLLGGNGDDIGNSLARDPSGDIYVTGTTHSTNNMATANAHQPDFGGGDGDYFLSKFTNQGQLLWSTYYGGSRDEYDGMLLNSATCDAKGNVYLCGYTTSFNNIATVNAHKSYFSGSGGFNDDYDAFLVKFSSLGVRQWGTYYGDTADDMGYDVVCDASGNVYLSGVTRSNNGIATPGTFMPTYGGLPVSYLAKFDANGSRVWGTYTSTNTLTDFAIGYDGMDGIYVIGTAAVLPNLSTPGSPQPNCAGIVDATLQRINTQGQRTFGTYFGGPHWDEGCSISFDQSGNIYFAGNTSSTSGIATAGAHQTTYSGGTPPFTGGDAFLVRYINDDTLVNITSGFTGTVLCQGNTNISVPYTVTYPFHPGNTFTVELSDASGSFTTPTVIGTANATGAGTVSCTIPASTAPGNNYQVRIVATSPATVSDGHSISIFPTVVPDISIAVQPGDTICAGENALFFINNIAYGGNSPQYQWQLNGNDIPGAVGTQYATTTLASGDAITCILTSNAQCLSGNVSDTSNAISMEVLPSVTPTVTIAASPDTIFSPGNSIIFTCTVTNGGNNPQYQWFTNGGAITGANTNTYTENNPQNQQNIWLRVISDERCAQPDTAWSNLLKLTAFNNIANVTGAQQLRLIPNPSHGRFTIKGEVDGNEALVEIYSYTGQKVWEQRAEAKNKQLSLSIALPHEPAQGLYFLKVSSGTRTEVHKLEIQY